MTAAAFGTPVAAPWLDAADCPAAAELPAVDTAPFGFVLATPAAACPAALMVLVTAGVETWGV
jgi:hypothetical protein